MSAICDACGGKSAAPVCPHCGHRRAPAGAGLGGVGLSKEEARALLTMHAPNTASEAKPIAAYVLPHPRTTGVGHTAATMEVIQRYHRDHGYLLDPHTAVGVYVAEQHLHAGEPMICLATAHPAKFPQAIADALGQDIARHPSLEALKNAPTRCVTLPNDLEVIRAYIKEHAR